MIFWPAVAVFFICGVLLAWGAQFHRMEVAERPRVLSMPWFSIAQAIGGIGFLVIPAMFYWRNGFIGAALAGGAYLLCPVIIGLSLRRFTG